jgi:hypothetical protein
MYMVALIALALTAPIQDLNPDQLYMQVGTYMAASRAGDPQALGGFGASDRFHKPMDRVYLKHGVSAQLVENKFGFLLVLANGSQGETWFRAGDSNILAHMEAKDRSGVWRPIEYKPWYSCGNSYHRLNLPAGEGWVFSVPIPRGSFETQVRWKYYGGETPLYSNELTHGIPETRFVLSPADSAKYEISTQFGPPTLMFKG